MYVNKTIELFKVVSVSAGMRGLQILLALDKYMQATGGKLGAIADLGLVDVEEAHDRSRMAKLQ